MITKLLGALIIAVLRPIINGALWAIGSSTAEYALTHKKEVRMFARAHFLFHPKITMGAFIAGLTALLVYAPDIKTAFGTKGLLFVIAGSVILAVCTYGRSPASAVDNNQPK